MILPYRDMDYILLNDAEPFELIDKTSGENWSSCFKEEDYELLYMYLAQKQGQILIVGSGVCNFNHTL